MRPGRQTKASSAAAPDPRSNCRRDRLIDQRAFLPRHSGGVRTPGAVSSSECASLTPKLPGGLGEARFCAEAALNRAPRAAERLTSTIQSTANVMTITAANPQAFMLDPSRSQRFARPQPSRTTILFLCLGVTRQFHVTSVTYSEGGISAWVLAAFSVGLTGWFGVAPLELPSNTTWLRPCDLAA